MFFVRYGKQEGKSSYDRVILDTLTFPSKVMADNFADIMRAVGYWTYCFDAEEYVRQTIIEMEEMANKIIQYNPILEELQFKKVSGKYFYKNKDEIF